MSPAVRRQHPPAGRTTATQRWHAARMGAMLRLSPNWPMRYHILAIFAASALAASSSALAADAITFDLQPRAAPTAPAQRTLSRPAARPAAPRTDTSARQTTNSTLVGRLGQISVDGATIYDSPFQTTTYARCKVGQPVILVGFNSQWYGVRMVDGRTGWVYRSQVQLSGASIRLPVAPPKTVSAATAAAPSGMNTLLSVAFGYMGIPYKWGGTSASGIDCSGFVQSVYKRFGAKLPRVARDQARVGHPVPPTREHLRPGDRLFFKATQKYVDHTGIYWGDGLMIHSSSGRGVDITPLWDGGLYERSLVSARRDFAP